MLGFYFTPISISYLTQFILASGIIIVLILHLRLPNNQITRSFLLTWFMGFVTIFIGMLFFESVTLGPLHLYIGYLENPILAIALVFLLQFAYRFPMLPIRRRWEGFVVLGLSLAYALAEILFAFYRIIHLQMGEVMFRDRLGDYIQLMFFLWIPLVFLYRFTALTTASEQGLRRKFTDMLHPSDPEAQKQRKIFWANLAVPATPELRAIRMFIFTAILLPCLAVLDIASGYNLVSATLGSLGTSLCILLGLFTFSMAYLNYQKDGISFMVKLAFTSLTLILAILIGVSWVISPPYVKKYQPLLPTEKQSVQFTPNEFGGYDITHPPFTYQNDLGPNYPLGNSILEACLPINFEFRFYREKYSQVYACKDGVISLGNPVVFRNIRNNYGAGLPLILPLLTNLAPEDYPGSVHINHQPENLVITWDEQHGYYQPQARFTFQVVLRKNGIFEFNYYGIPTLESGLLT
ncbi:MAG: hypothetical protein WCK35_00355 [Chloroflexota bacterium]